MSSEGPVPAVPAANSTALVAGGLRRGALLVFLPVFVAGQALAWLTYAASGWYRPWSWFKIGIAETLSSVRVTFAATTADGRPAGQLVVATGALTIAVLVLSYRAGREQARGSEASPRRAALAGTAIAPGFAVPMVVLALLVTLGFPQFGVERLRPVLWQAAVLPLLVVGIAGAIGGLTVAEAPLEDGPPWIRRGVAAVRGGATAFWWAIVLSFVGFLAVAAASPGPTGAYARFVSRTGGSGAATLIEHAVLVPNQSALVLATAMGSTTSISVGELTAVELTRSGVAAVGDVGGFLASYVGAAATDARFPGWFALFLLAPLVGTIIGGHAAADDERGRERVIRGAAAGIVYAALCVMGAWAATLVVPVQPGLVTGSLVLRTDVVVTLALALVWGVVGCAVGAVLPWPATRRP